MELQLTLAQKSIKIYPVNPFVPAKITQTPILEPLSASDSSGAVSVEVVHESRHVLLEDMLRGPVAVRVAEHLREEKSTESEALRYFLTLCRVSKTLLDTV